MKFYNHLIKKKTIHLVLSLALTSSLMTAGCSSQSTTTTTTEIAVGENQRLVQGQIQSIAGNEISLAILAANTQTEASLPADGSSAQTEPSLPADGTDGQTRPSRPMDGSGDGSGDGTRPSRPADGSGGPGGTGGMGRQQPPEGATGDFTPPDGNTLASMDAAAAPALAGSSEILQLSIPVGTDILTTQGKTTTFSRLAAGDTVQVLLETTADGEVVVGVWMVDLTATATETTSDDTANH